VLFRLLPLPLLLKDSLVLPLRLSLVLPLLPPLPPAALVVATCSHLFLRLPLRLLLLFLPLLV